MNDADLQSLLESTKTIAVVGISDKPHRDSHHVAEYLQKHGYRIIPVNPKLKEVLGEKAYPNLKAVPVKIDLVDIFRRSEDVPPVVDEAIEVGAKAAWMQLGIVNEGAAEKARRAGLQVVMDRCLLVEHRRLIG